MEIKKKTEPKKYTAFIEWLKEKIGERVNTKEYGTQRDLAEAAGMSPSTLSSYKQGYFFPGEDHVQKLAKVLDVHPEDIERFRYQFDEGTSKQEYTLTEGELENLINQRLGENIDLIVARVVSKLQPQYEDIGQRLQEIQEEYQLLRRRYDSLVDVHTKFLEKYLSQK